MKIQAYRNLLLLWLISTFLSFQSCQPSEPAIADTLFTLLPSSYTNVTFSNQLQEDEHWNIIKYLYYYNGGGVAIGDVNLDGLPDIFFTANQLPNRLYLNLGNLRFEDVTEKAGIAGKHGGTSWKTGVTMADINGDGFLDIYVSQVGFYKRINGENELFINNGDGTFTEKATELGLNFKGFGQQAAFFDYDLDGDLDAFLLNHSVHSAESYDQASQRAQRDPQAGDRLLKNENGHFKDVSEAAGIWGGSMGYGLGLVVGDINNDGYPDIYVTNDFHENDYCYLNNQDGTFRESIKDVMGHSSKFSMGCDLADINNDGWLDAISLDMKPEEEQIYKSSAGVDHYNLYYSKLGFGYHYQHPRNTLQLNRGISAADSIPRFSEIGQLAGVATTDWSWGALFADFDNDGWKDLFITNGIWRRPNNLDYLKFASNEEIKRSATDKVLAAKMPSGQVSNYAFKNEKDLTFLNVTQAWGLDLIACSNGVAYADLDKDGDLDLVVNNLNAEASIYRNNAVASNNHKWLKINLIGLKKNKFGIGARVTIKVNGETQIQEMTPTRGWQSSVDYALNFGLGNTDNISELMVRWGDGKVQKLKNIASNQTLVLQQSEAKLETVATPQLATLLKDVTNKLKLPFVHRENRFINFNIEGLIPHQLSTESPKIAVGDVNADGLDDFFIGGAKGQIGNLFLQTQDGKTPFVEKPIPDLTADLMKEDVDAIFFDADADKDLDLYIVSGGGEYREGAKQLQDRLYQNDGRGNFRKMKKALPETTLNGSCVVAGDFDKNGSLDLFVGSRSVPGSYGTIPASQILWNDGRGNFETAFEDNPDRAKLGMITNAIWVEKMNALMVIGEWMEPTFVTIQKNALESANPSTFSNSKGWWTTIAAGDFDKDGDLDFLAGNMGLNSNLQTTPEKPVQLFVDDFDENGQLDPILSYFRQDKPWVLPAKDELSAQVVPFRKRFTDYQSYANSTLTEVFTPEELEKATQYKAETFASTYFQNDGNGKYTNHSLPIQTQFSPIRAIALGDFDKDGHQDALAVGNFSSNQPSIGRYDASYGCFLKGDGQGNFEILDNAKSGFIVLGEARDVKLLRNQGILKWVLVARNNQSIQIFENGFD